MSDPEANIALVRRLYGAFSRGDHGALLEALHPDVEWLPMRSMLEGRTYKGRRAVAKLLEEEGPLRELDVEPYELVPVGTFVLASVRLRGRGRASGVEVEDRLADLWMFRGDQVIRFQAFSDLARAREAAGLGDTASADQQRENR